MIIRQINKYHFAFGLKWMPLRGLPGLSAKDEAREVLMQENLTDGVIFDYQGRVIVGGFPKHRKHQIYSAALVLAAREKQAIFLAKLSATEYWVCQAGNGQFNLDTDVILTAHAAIEMVRSLYSKRMSAGSHLVTIYITPEIDGNELGFTSTHAIDLSTLLALIAPPEDALITKIGGRSTREKLLLWSAVLLVAYAGGAAIIELKKQSDAARAALAEQQKKLNLSNNQMSKETAIQVAVQTGLKNDTETPLPSDIYRYCQLQIRAFGHYFHGWQVTSISCSTSQSIVALALNSNEQVAVARLDALYTAAESLGAQITVDTQLQNASLVMQNDTLNHRLALTNVSELPTSVTVRRTIGDALLLKKQVISDFQFDLGDFTGRGLMFTDPTFNPAQGANSPELVPVADSYLEANLTIKANYEFDLPLDLIDAPHIRLDGVDFQLMQDRTSATAHIHMIARP